MARRRTATVDTSDPLSSGMMIGLTVFILGTLGALYLINSGDTQTLSADGLEAPASETITASRVPATPDEQAGAPADEASGVDGAGVAAGQDTDSDGDTAADDESDVDVGEPPDDAGDATAGDGSGADGPATGATEPPASADDGATTTPPPGDGDADADSGGRRGLFSPDDPERVPAITVSTSPRDVLTAPVDVDGDGVAERVWAAIVQDQVHTRIERVSGGRWVPQEARRGAAADRLVALQVSDLTGDGRPEVHTRQWVATEGGSLTVWALRDGDLARMRMTGGCYNDSNTVGITGAVIEDVNASGATIAAVCRDEGLPPQQWSSAIYVWRDGRWDFDGRQGRYR